MPFDQACTQSKAGREPFVAGDPVIQSDGWAERAAHWSSSEVTARPRKKQVGELRSPLVLTGHGMRLRLNHGALEIRNGFTHYPQQREEWRYFKGEQRRPSRILLLDGDGGITLDVLGSGPIKQFERRGLL